MGVYTLRALLEVARGRPQRALELERTAIRLAYVRPEPRDIAISHHQIANRMLETEDGSGSGTRPPGRRCPPSPSDRHDPRTRWYNQALGTELRQDGGRETACQR